MLSAENRYPMDDDADEVVIHQTLFSHMKIVTHFFWGLPLNVASLVYFSKHLCMYLLKPESLAVVAALVLAFFVCSSNDSWCQRFKFAKFLRRNTLFVNPVDFLGDHETWEYDKDGCGVFALRGKRAKMEDRFSVIEDKASGISLYGIFDGHGGEFAAEFVVKHLFSALLKKLQTAAKNGGPEFSANVSSTTQSLIKEFAQLLTEEILAIDTKLLVKVKASQNVAGTTALVAAVYKNQLIVANVGDSRGVICDSKGNAVPLSFDHKPQQLKEHRRIKEAGGFITFNGVWRVAGVLATSRALGDFPLKDRKLVIAEPDILTFNLTDMKPQFMILATDGLWDAFTNEDAVNFVRERITEPYNGAKSLALQAYKNGSVDNITVMIVNFQSSELQS